MPDETASRYDGVLYPGHAYEATHIARLATLGSLYGMDPGPITHARVLELGCGTGGNLIPMAYQYPESEFIGIDLSKRAIENGSTSVAALGLKNIELRYCDIMDVTADLGRFDYIITHGVYSWVPPAVRDKILSIFASHLSPQGIGYVSYNAHPGSHLRDLVRDAMLYHVSDIADTTRQVGQARAVVKMLSEATAADSVYGAVVRDQFARLQRMSDELIFHDDLDTDSTPFLLHKVVTDAKRHGLQYLCDAVLSRRDLSRYPEGIRNMLAQFPDSAFSARDQYQDFIDGYGFRRTLLCRDDVQLNRALTPDCIARFHIASSAAPASENIEPGEAGVVEFKTEDSYSLFTDHRLSKAALIRLGQCWPAAIAFPVLLQSARKRLATGAESGESGSEQEVAALMRVLFDAVCAGLAEIHLDSPPLTTAISERPLASLLARKQTETNAQITSLRHGGVRLEDERLRRFLMLVNGTRSLNQLVEDLREATVNLPLGADQPAVTRESVETHLRVLAKAALLVA